ncbi:bifunctional diguanylate cyclase/phosphodiesterase [Alteromonas sp. 5E99-2]|uniref:putative bifunctional diguanylate cyclase/phosphodiesterase n=1 Tax=Alteromonas sp. 5E99-2 TaxID=2817683 RepID=UPI001A993ECB|nr:bifunctional diguanylate cyclase/phosphodiesterase [Alteromonas sp. 5E99-2]MBO1255987.1 bifunctional diguanylate cyclase/phosphodiesterase [Alteromonas sp. 5E99-2]
MFKFKSAFTRRQNHGIAFFLVVISMIVWVTHRLGYMDIEKDLFASKPENVVSTIFTGNVSGSIVDIKGNKSVECKLSDKTEYSVCGISFALGESISDGLDLSSFNSIELNIAYQAPFENPKLRVSFRNYNDAYSFEDDFVSLKFNSIVYSPSNHPPPIKVPLSAFHVESWWIDQYRISFDNAMLDFTNIAYIEVVSNSLSELGDYRMIVKQAKLHGQLVSEGSLLKLILLFWLVIIILLISMQRNKLDVMSNTDALTGLLNRRGLDNWVEKYQHFLSKKTKLVMFYFDIDDFKKINDTYGHLVGDEILRGFCDKMSTIIEPHLKQRYSYAFCRLAGDEFALLVKDIRLADTAPIAKEMIQSLASPLVLSQHIIKLNVSLGIAASDASSKTFDALMVRADSAMYLAKKNGKNQFKLFDEQAASEMLFRKKIAENLKNAIEDNAFTLNFMPIFDTKTLVIVGCEILIRCKAKSLEGIGPDQFIPIAEQYDLIQTIDLWVLESTIQLIAQHQQALAQNTFKFCINISALELKNKHFAKAIAGLLKKYSLAASFIELEVTETSLVEVDEISITILNELKQLGISLALDDFGTGYTAFSQLIRYPVDSLKIDKSFIDNLNCHTEAPKTTVNAILSIAKSYKLLTVAEGIESQSQIDYLKHHGCDRLQGFYLSKPLSWDEMLTQLNSQP